MIRQCRCSTSSIAGQPLVGRPQADACMGRQSSERDMLLQVTPDPGNLTLSCQLNASDQKREEISA